MTIKRIISVLLPSFFFFALLMGAFSLGFWFHERFYPSVSMPVYAEAMARLEQDFVDEIPNQTNLEYGAIRGALETLNDPYTRFLEPVLREKEQQKHQGHFGGIGATISEEKGQFVFTVLPDNPAEKAGLQTGDQLILLDGKPYPEDATPETIADQIRGEVGTIITLTISREGKEIEIPVERGEILLPSVYSKLVDGIGYIQLTRFSDRSADEIEKAINELQTQSATQFILDLRDNGGGLIDAAVNISDHFLANEIVMIQTYKQEADKTHRTTEKTLLPNAPLVLLVNGYTASSAEILAGALQDHKRATLIGTKTYGKGSVQVIYDLQDDSSIHITWSKWKTPNGRLIDKNGLEPDLLIEQEGDKDTQLEAALNYLKTETE